MVVFALGIEGFIVFFCVADMLQSTLTRLKYTHCGRVINLIWLKMKLLNIIYHLDLPPTQSKWQMKVCRDPSRKMYVFWWSGFGGYGVD